MSEAPVAALGAALEAVLEGVSLRLGGRQVLRDASLALEAGAINCLLGASGCGKSTLLRVAAGLLPPDTGQVLARPQDCAMVFQAPRLLRWLTVGENLGLALAHRRGMKRAQKAQRIGQALEVVQLAGAQALFPHELSGGMAQRVGIARALLREPRLLLMDEPFAALDAITRRSLQAALRQLIATRQTTCLFVTHDVDEALALGRRLFVMQAGRVARQWNAPWRADEARSQIVQALRAADAASALSVSTAAPVSPVSFP